LTRGKGAMLIYANSFIDERKEANAMKLAFIFWQWCERHGSPCGSVAFPEAAINRVGRISKAHIMVNHFLHSWSTFHPFLFDDFAQSGDWYGLSECSAVWTFIRRTSDSVWQI